MLGSLCLESQVGIEGMQRLVGACSKKRQCLNVHFSLWWLVYLLELSSPGSVVGALYISLKVPEAA